MRVTRIAGFCLLRAIPGLAQHSTDPGPLSFTGAITTLTASGTATNGELPSGSLTYLSLSSTETVSTSASQRITNGTKSVSTGTSTSATLSLIGGGEGPSSTTRSTGTSTSSTNAPKNTQSCNGYTEFCSRRYSNVTEVCAHNSPFVRAGNIAANQQLDVTYQLNDGIRMLQGQVHFENNTLYLCHTSCNVLNVGTLEDYLRTVTDWISGHPYDVVTILLGNFDNVDASTFVAPIQNSGLGRYLYEPPKVPMGLNDWPTLSEMIISGKRAVFFLDYHANQTAVPYILDEFNNVWETPFSPTNLSFPCTVERPPKLSNKNARNRMYMANHNLNIEISLAGNDLLIPNTVELNDTNGVTGPSSLGNMSRRCTREWGRPPRFLLVDYYNIPANGSVFEVAAQMNNVKYRGTCCGTTGQSVASLLVKVPSLLGVLGVSVASVLLLST